MRSLIGIASLLMLVLTTNAMAQSADWNVDTESHRFNNIEGSWELDVRSDPGPGAPPPFKALVTFDSGGGVIETILLPPIVPAHGEWIRVSRSRFEFAVVHPLLDASGNHVATIRVTSHVRMTSANELTATFEGNVHDPDGNILGPISGTETGKRIIVR